MPTGHSMVTKKGYRSAGKRREALGSAGSAGSAKSAENILPTYSTPEITQPHVMSGTYVAVLRSKTCEPAEKAMT